MRFCRRQGQCLCNCNQCAVKESKKLGDSGVLENWDYGLDAEFVVDKGTGRMNGKLKNLGFFGEPTIIDPGSN